MWARAFRWFGDQCAQIDADHKRDDLPRSHAAGMLLLTTLVVVMPKVVGSPEAFEAHDFPRTLFGSLPAPEMHAQLFWALWKGVQYGILPWLCVRFVLGRGLRSHGLVWPAMRGSWLLVGLALLVMVPITLLASRDPAFAATYPKCPGAGDSLIRLLVWEVAYAFQFIMVELFYRGVLLFSLSRSLGWLAIFVMAVPYTMIHLQKPLAECVGSIFTGIVLGAFALRTRSIAGGAVVHCAVGLCMDLGSLQAKGALFGH
jgi:membrane protease YdiL (CAAX protease family)